MILEVLLVDDSPGDVRLTREAFRDATIPIRLHVASDGEEAMDFLRNQGRHANAPRPDLILLDLHLPRMDGRAVLTDVNMDESLKQIPVIVLMACDVEVETLESQDIRPQGYLSKPVRLVEFDHLVKNINESWLTMVSLPRQMGQ